MINALAYVVTLVLFAAIDTVWLGTMAARIYRPLLGDILLTGFRAAPAVVFYLFYAVGLLIFAVLPALKGGSVGTALLWGALFGLFAYGTYDLTNYATLRNWGATITMIDMAWGTFLSGTAAALSFLVTTWLARLIGLTT
ncbi:DUF2177 family protein [Kaistia dalseonensis]|uniref:Membrane protein n=1 Tax=Kaistia dalseonensis TaxID=410840 RepID=A0ABU0H9X8_9HYPH|nr:DUF2177 family protein [Kaistia dalseonensis]MCX5495688.1 DUF2177 family protein [Kaistia dalseonensis]MDQ0438284.1 putative membrane protein [Kaistia dalseonensis]